MIPPAAPSAGTAISTVGVVDRPKSTTSMPIPFNVAQTRSEIIFPEGLASRPTTTFLLPSVRIIRAKAAVNFTTSKGVRASPLLPPIVPLIPDIDLINVTRVEFKVQN